ncbi:amidase [Ruegeria arenilitoris]|uniref:amidase n=1 Tax=Ruegeria arenilitoris TaxID=1173585 RepID=UPI00147B8DEB|nr:amidase [Ruegeria arenilitoris]
MTKDREIPDSDGTVDNSSLSDPLGLRTATQLSEGLASGSFSSVELLQHYVERAEKHNPVLNAIVAMNVEQATKQAKSSDARRARGETLSPIDGLPMTIKDAFQVVGLPATAGAVELEGFMPSQNAVEVQRLLDAGVVIFGKTNVPRFVAGFESYNALFGTTNNPWDVSRTPGGSSGGPAAATAAGLTSFEIGSDLGGSVRVPPHFCGIFDHKPTHGITQMRGHIPGPPGTVAEPDMAVVGPIARSAQDLSLVLPYMIGPVEICDKGWSLSLPPRQGRKIEEFRVAVLLDDSASETDIQMCEHLTKAIRRLEEAGAVVTYTKPEDELSAAFSIFIDLITASIVLPPDVRASVKAAVAAGDPNDDSINAHWQRGLVAEHAQWLTANETRCRMRSVWSHFFSQYDVLLTPPMGIPAFPHNQTDNGGNFVDATLNVNGRDVPYLSQLFWCGFASLLGFPATVVPSGLSHEGLPVGLQIIGDFLNDNTTLEFAELIEEVLGGYVPPHGFR